VNGALKRKRISGHRNEERGKWVPKDLRERAPAGGVLKKDTATCAGSQPQARVGKGQKKKLGKGEMRLPEKRDHLGC